MKSDEAREAGASAPAVTETFQVRASRGSHSSTGLQPLLTLPEVAALLRVHEKTVCLWARQRSLTCIRLGGRLRFDQRDVLRWIAARKEG